MPLVTEGAIERNHGITSTEKRVLVDIEPLSFHFYLLLSARQSLAFCLSLIGKLQRRAWSSQALVGELYLALEI